MGNDMSQRQQDGKIGQLPSWLVTPYVYQKSLAALSVWVLLSFRCVSRPQHHVLMKTSKSQFGRHIVNYYMNEIGRKSWIIHDDQT